MEKQGLPPPWAGSGGGGALLLISRTFVPSPSPHSAGPSLCTPAPLFLGQLPNWGKARPAAEQPPNAQGPVSQLGRAGGTVPSHGDRRSSFRPQPPSSSPRPIYRLDTQRVEEGARAPEPQPQRLKTSRGLLPRKPWTLSGLRVFLDDLSAAAPVRLEPSLAPFDRGGNRGTVGPTTCLGGRARNSAQGR